MESWSDEKESVLQGLLASSGFVDSAIKRLSEEKPELAIKYMNNALTIITKLTKSLRGF